MRILLPYVSQAGEKLGESDNITGGMEKHIHSIFKEFDCVPLNLTVTEKSKFHEVKRKMEAAISKYKPDLVYNNYHVKSLNTDKIPCVMHWHNTNGGSLMHLNLVNLYKQLKEESSILIAGVSKFQEQTYHSLSQRLFGTDLKFDSILRPDFVENPNSVVDPLYGICTIGRLEEMKDPLFAKKVADKCGVSYKIFTTKYTDELKRSEHNPKSQAKVKAYYDKHQLDENHHVQGAPYDKTMESLGKSAVYVSTCEVESFGITVLESLSRGVPCILCAKPNSSHASVELSPNPDYVRVINKKTKGDEYQQAYKELVQLDRQKIAQDTIDMHSKENWKKSYEDVFQSAINKFSENTVTLF